MGSPSVDVERRPKLLLWGFMWQCFFPSVFAGRFSSPVSLSGTVRRKVGFLLCDICCLLIFSPCFTLKSFIFWSMGHTSGWSNSVEICCHFQNLSSTACPIPALRGQTGSTFKVWFVKRGPITHRLCRCVKCRLPFFSPRVPWERRRAAQKL